MNSADRQPCPRARAVGGLEALVWSNEQGPQARRALATAAGLVDGNLEAREVAGGRPDFFGARRKPPEGIEIEPFDVWADRSPRALEEASPLLLDLPGVGLLAVLRCTRTHAIVHPPRGPLRRLRLEDLDEALWAAANRDPGTRELTREAEGLVATLCSELSGRRAGRHSSRSGRGVRERMARALMAPALHGRLLATGYRIRSTATHLRRELTRARILWPALLVPVVYAIQLLFFVRVWAAAGALVLSGRPASAPSEGGRRFTGLFLWLAAWVAAHLLTSASMARLAVEVGGVIRAWLMRLMLRLDPQQLRHAGIGDLLGRVLEAESLDALAMGGGAQALGGVFELGGGIIVMEMSGARALPLLSAALGLALLATAARSCARRFSSWAAAHRGLTCELVERMCGQATVLIQDCPKSRAEGDARDVAGYAAAARLLDRAETTLAVVVPRVWLLATLAILTVTNLGGGAGRQAGLEPSLVSASALPGLRGVAVATLLGGIWLFYSGLRRLAGATPALVRVRHAWIRIAMLLADQDPAATPEEGIFLPGTEPSPWPASPAATPDPPTAAIDPDGGGLIARQLSFRYPGAAAFILEGVDLSIRAGDRILIEGPSGGGKSTLSALLSGLKRATTGALSLDRVTQQTLGIAAWRRRVGVVPQFHDNHVLSGLLLFNLLMGRRWPPRNQDVQAAAGVCSALGLDPLLARMPAGLQQQVGETGWQLSHGERSRIFLARSLLQSLDVRVLDETFAALDAQTLDEVMRVVLAEPATLLVVAHP